jgi:hypothetical protein
MITTKFHAPDSALQCHIFQGLENKVERDTNFSGSQQVAKVSLHCKKIFSSLS